MVVLVPLAAGFEEIEAVTVIDVLRRARLDVVVAGLIAGPCRGSRGVVVVPDVTLDSVVERRFEAIVLPGGGPGAQALRSDPRVIELLRQQHARGGVIGAICAAPIVLERAGILVGRAATAHPAVRAELRAAGVDVRDDPRVCTAGEVITSQGPGTAMEFAYALVERLAGAAVVEELEAGILSRRNHHAP